MFVNIEKRSEKKKVCATTTEKLIKYSNCIFGSVLRCTVAKREDLGSCNSRLCFDEKAMNE